MNELKLKEFAIYGLYGDRDVIIPFPYQRKVLVSEHGGGKTTVLNAMYAVLNGMFMKLDELPFERIVVSYNRNTATNTATINKADILKYQMNVGTLKKLKLFPSVIYLTADRRFSEFTYAVRNLEVVAFEKGLTTEIMEKFVTISNSYLIGKQFIFTFENKNTATWRLEIRTMKNRVLQLDSLSSGEKQILTILYWTYMRLPKPCAVLIDEPELSLGVDLQNRLLPDILQANCQFLIAATKSPFIFDNDLATNTVDLHEYIREY